MMARPTGVDASRDTNDLDRPTPQKPGFENKAVSDETSNRPLIDFSVLQEAYSKLPSDQLWRVYDAMTLACEGLQGVYNSPGVQDGASVNVIGEVMDELLQARCYIVEEAKERTVTLGNAKHLCRIVLAYEVECHESPLELAKIALGYTNPPPDAIVPDADDELPF